MIVFEKITKKFPPGNFALNNISFEIEKGEFVFLVGPSGAGKSTILRLIIRDLVPTSGTIIIDDLDITDKKFNQTPLLRQKIGMVFQDFKVLFDKNVFENITLSLQVLDLPLKKIKNEVNQVLKLVGLEEKKYFFPIQLSVGELQRVAIARAILGNREIVLADEPTGNLDPKTSWEIMRLFKKISLNKTVIIATHSEDIVNSFQKRVIGLKDGSLLKDEKKGKYSL